jgi:hypothetical protein
MFIQNIAPRVANQVYNIPPACEIDLNDNVVFEANSKIALPSCTSLICRELIYFQTNTKRGQSIGITVTSRPFLVSKRGAQIEAGGDDETRNVFLAENPDQPQASNISPVR